MSIETHASVFSVFIALDTKEKEEEKTKQIQNWYQFASESFVLRFCGFNQIKVYTMLNIVTMTKFKEKNKYIITNNNNTDTYRIKLQK